MASRFMEDVVRNGYSDRGKIQRNKVSTLELTRPVSSSWRGTASHGEVDPRISGTTQGHRDGPRPTGRETPCRMDNFGTRSVGVLL